jgi:16S rRNA A1518/A1519 N6-dimethyltransferase RsmA/KsgA/DIM1 with predicted DNA glycosylase/AP lyase activity
MIKMAAETDYVSIILFIILVVLIVTTFWSSRAGAPWLPTSMKMVHKMLIMAEVGPEDVVYDLGCGDGRIVITAAMKYKAKAVGIEIDPIRFLWCQFLITILGLRRRVRIIFGDFFSTNLSEATVVTCYLLQETNNKLERKFLNELNPGTKVVSNAFTFASFPERSQDSDAKLYLIPEE